MLKPNICIFATVKLEDKAEIKSMLISNRGQDHVVNTDQIHLRILLSISNGIHSG